MAHLFKTNTDHCLITSNYTREVVSDFDSASLKFHVAGSTPVAGLFRVIYLRSMAGSLGFRTTRWSQEKTNKEQRAQWSK